MSAKFGHDFSQVRVHTDARASETAEALGAEAYTVGEDIVFGEGQYDPGSRDGERLIAHELTHVVQQAQGGVGDPDRVSRQGDASEREAEDAADRVLAGESVHVSAVPQAAIARREDDDDRGTPPAAVGVGGALGRETLVRTQEGRAYDAGATAPRIDFDGTLHRTVPSSRWEGYANHLFSDKGGGRYNDPGQRLIYASPSAGESLGEMSAYGTMANQTRAEFNYNAAVDPTTGQGGVADVTNNLGNLGLTRDALTAHKGGGQPDFWHRLTGEDPYLFPRAVGRGASDAGASGLLVPSATGGDQLDIIPRNTEPTQIQYEQHVPYDAAGNPMAPVVDPAHLAQHAGAGGGPGAMPDGLAPSPHGSDPATSTGRTTRGGSARYGALGAGGVALVRDLMDGDLSARDAGDVAVQTGSGALGGVAQDALHARLGGGIGGGVAAGGAISALTSGAFSTWDNAEAYRQGRETAGQATANTVVDTGVGLGAGLAGAAAGAAIGSVIPIAGTAVGAGVGFLAGMGGSMAASYLAEHSGFTDWAKKGLGGYLNNDNESLSGAWNGISHATGAVSDTVGNAWHGLTGWFGGGEHERH